MWSQSHCSVNKCSSKETNKVQQKQLLVGWGKLLLRYLLCHMAAQDSCWDISVKGISVTCDLHVFRPRVTPTVDHLNSEVDRCMPSAHGPLLPIGIKNRLFFQNIVFTTASTDSWRHKKIWTAYQADECNFDALLHCAKNEFTMQTYIFLEIVH